MLRRPMVMAALALAAGIASAHIADCMFSLAVLTISAAASAGLLFYLLHKWKIIEIFTENDGKPAAPPAARTWRRRAALAAALFFVLGAVISPRQAASSHTRTTATVTGTVTRVRIIDAEKARLTLRTAGRGPFASNLLLTITGYESGVTALTGCRVTVTGSQEAPAGASNPGSFDYALWLRSQKIYTTMSCNAAAVRLVSRPHGAGLILSRIAVMKYAYEKMLIASFDEKAAGALCGILFGESTFMDEEMLESFRENGIGHLLATSGLHVGFVYGLLRVLMRRPSTLGGNLPIVAALVVYAAMAGFSASVVRAVFMVIVHMVSQIRHRRYDFLSCIAFCFFVLLLYEPASLFASGFQLSFLAVMTLAVIMRRFAGSPALPDDTQEEQIPEADGRSVTARPLAESLRSRLRAELAAIAGIQAGMLPMTLICFHYISPAALLLNVPAIAVAGLIIPLGILMIPVWGCLYIPLISHAAQQVLMFMGDMTEMLVNLLVKLNDIADASPLSFEYVASPPLPFVLLYYFAVFFFCSEAWELMKQRPDGAASCAAARCDVTAGGGGEGCRASVKPRLKAAAALLAAVLVTGCGIWVACAHEYLFSDVVFVDVGQGDCAHIRAKGGVDIMVDSGGSSESDIGKNVLIPYFLGNGTGSLDLAVITHLHTDHYDGLRTVTEGVKVRKLLLSAAYRDSAQQVEEETGISTGDMIFASRGDVIRPGGGVRITVLSPAVRTDAEYSRLLAEDAENEISLVARIEYKGRSMLFTGDIGTGLEEDLCASVADLLPADVLKVAHHGSKNSSSEDFLRLADPDISVIQVGRRNMYGHPTREAMDRISAAGSQIFRTDRQGAVMMRFGRRIRVSTCLE